MPTQNEDFGVVEATDINMAQLHGSGSSIKVWLLLKVLMKLPCMQAYESRALSPSEHANMLNICLE
jgi:hypothetical protein